MTEPLDPVHLDENLFQSTLWGRTAGPASTFASELGIDDWPTEYWTMVLVEGQLQVQPAVLVRNYTVVGTIDTGVLPLALAVANVMDGEYEIPDNPTGVPDVEVYHGIFSALDPDEAATFARAAVAESGEPE